MTNRPQSNMDGRPEGPFPQLTIENAPFPAFLRRLTGPRAPADESEIVHMESSCTPDARVW